MSMSVATFQANYTAVGLGPIPPGSSVDDAVKGLQKQLKTVIERVASRFSGPEH